MTFKVFVDIQIIFYGTSPNYLESRAGKITVKEGRESRDQVPQRQLQLLLKTLCPGLSLECFMALPIPSAQKSCYQEWAGKQSTGKSRVRTWLDKLTGFWKKSLWPGFLKRLE